MSAPTSSQTPTKSPASINATLSRGYRNTSSVSSTAITRRDMYGQKLHPVLRDEPTGRRILSGKHRELGYKLDVAMLDDISAEARDVQGKLTIMVARADTNETLVTKERRELASRFCSLLFFPPAKSHANSSMANVQFLMNKGVGDSLSHEHVNLALVHEGDKWFRGSVLMPKCGTR